MQSRRRQPGGVLEWLGGRSPLMPALGLALVLILAGTGLIVFALNARQPAEKAAALATPTSVAIITVAETPTPAATVATTPTPTQRVPPSPPRPAATAVARSSPATPRPVASPAALGSGQSRAVRGLAGSMVAATGGATLPAAITTPGPTVSAQGPIPPTPTYAPPPYIPPTPAVAYNPPPVVPPTPTRAPAPPAPYVPPPAPYVPPPVYNPPPVNNPPPAPVNTPVPAPPTVPTPPTAPPGSAPTPLQLPTPVPTAVLPPTAIPTPAVPTAIPVPPLPAASLPSASAQPYRYDLAFSLAANLDALPKSANAYKVIWRAFTADQAAAIARSVGIAQPVQQTGDGYRAASATASLTIASGALRYTVTGSAPPPPPQAPGAATATPPPNVQLTDDMARDAARRWLEPRGLWPGNAGEGRVTRPISGQTVVTFSPTDPPGEFPDDPQITILFDETATVRDLRYRWPNEIQPRPVPLRSANEAWADAQAGNGYTELDIVVPPRAAPGSAFGGSATVTSVSIGWAVGASGDGMTYLIPVYVFEGTAILDGSSREVTFRTFVPAMAKS